MSTQEPHRGVLILVLGILGLVLCQIFGIFAWVMGKGDLEKIDQGIMDPEGRGMTQAGMICGMISVALLVIGILGGLVMVLFLGTGVAVSGGS